MHVIRILHPLVMIWPRERWRGVNSWRMSSGMGRRRPTSSMLSKIKTLFVRQAQAHSSEVGTLRMTDSGIWKVYRKSLSRDLDTIEEMPLVAYETPVTRDHLIGSEGWAKSGASSQTNLSSRTMTDFKESNWVLMQSRAYILPTEEPRISKTPLRTRLKKEESNSKTVKSGGH